MRGWADESPLVGREDELRQLEDALGHRAVRPGVFVGGEAGIGKSRLVCEFAARAAGRGATVAVGGCLESGGDTLPFAPFVEALGRLREHLGAAAHGVFSPGEDELAAIVPDLGPAPTPPADRIRLFEAVRSVFDRVPDPTILVVEDAQWADESSLDLLSYLVRRARHGQLLAVVTFRTDEVAPQHRLERLVAELAHSGRAARLDLGPLSSANVAALVRHRRPNASDDEIDAIAGRSEGNPLLAQEILRSGRPDGLPVGPLREIIRLRLGSLSVPTRQLLALAAIAGRAVTVPFLEATWVGADTELDRALHEALGPGFLLHEAADGKIRFRHVLIGEVVRDDLGPREQRDLHGRIAAALAGQPDLGDPTAAGSAAELAGHWAAAGRLPEALDASLRAAGAAARVPAWAEAHAQYRRALDLWERVPSSERPTSMDLLDLLHRAAEATYMAGDIAGAIDLERRATQVPRTRPEPARLGACYAALARWYVEAPDATAMLEAAQRAVDLVPPSPPTAERALALATTASALMQWCRYRDSLRNAREAMAVAAAVGAVATHAWSHALVGLCLADLGDDDGALEEADRAVALAATAGDTEGATDVWAVISAYGDRAAVLRRRQWDPADRVEHSFEQLRAAADRWDARGSADSWATGIRLLVQFQAGAWDDVAAQIGPALAVDPYRAPWMSGLRASIMVARGQLDEAEADLRALLSIGEAPSPELACEARFDLALGELARGRPGLAVEIGAGAAGALMETDAPILMVRTAALRLRAAADLAELGRARRDREALARAERAAAEGRAALQAALAATLVPGMVVGRHIRAAIAWGLAEASRFDGRSDAALWGDAAAQLAFSWRPDLAAYARYREAEAILHGRRDRAAATAALEESRRLAARLGVAPLLAEIDGLARRGRIELGPPTSGSTPEKAGERAATSSDETRFGLSVREREVLALLVEGRTNREIGAALFITEKTASVHVTHIMDKLGVTSRGAAAALAGRLGLLDPDARHAH